MSSTATVVAAPKVSWFKKVENFFATVLKKSPTFLQRTETFLPYVAGVLQTILAFADPALSLAIGPFISKFESDLGTISAVIQDGTPAAGSSAVTTLETALNSLKTNAASVLGLAEVKTSASQEKITAELNALVETTDALLGNLPTAAAEAPAPAPAA
jgi:hypothetical protein